jgi:hypothetical protein
VARKRFNREERAAFTVNARIEWRNGSHWHEGRITGPITADVDTWQRVPLEHTGRTTATVSHGQRITGTPGAVRIPGPKCERCGQPVVAGYEIPDPDMPCPGTRSERAL